MADVFQSVFGGSLSNILPHFPGSNSRTATGRAGSPIDPLISDGNAGPFSGINYLERLYAVRPDQLLEDLTTINSSGDPNAQGSVQLATTDSIFNKFSVFRYSKFTSGYVYRPEFHFIGADAKGNKAENFANGINEGIQNAQANNYFSAANEISQLNQQTQTDETQKRIAALESDQANRLKVMLAMDRDARNFQVRNQSVLANPTARKIIEWSKSSGESVTGYQPYAMTDFIFCKNYGIIPNNRLVTLRRYPFPVNDQLRSPSQPELNPIPIAQAVTWFGGGSNNQLSQIGVMNWNLKWETLTVDSEQQITGNEILASDLIGFVKGATSLGKAADPIVKALEAAVSLSQSGGNGAAQLSGMDEKYQKYLKELYTTGPYWNRIFGPVNVINQSTRRARGMQDGWTQEFNLEFHYSFRSFNGLSPRVVALDLIASFLNLTYNDAQFLGQLARYFPRTGVKFSPNVTELLGDILTKWGTSYDVATTDQIIGLMQEVLKGIETLKNSAMETITDVAAGNTERLTEGGKKVVQAALITVLKQAMPNIISAKSALSDRPVGEWHLVVGNPMNPILVMGDLVCTRCTLKWDDEMGPDDFPTGCTFTIGLKQGKPRDKVSIERMFNLGETKLLSNPLRKPSSAEDTFGTENNTLWNNISSSQKVTSDAEKTQIINGLSEKVAATDFTKYRNRIRKTYGYQYVGNVGSGDLTQKDAGVVSTLNDTILWQYYDRGQERT